LNITLSIGYLYPADPDLFAGSGISLTSSGSDSSECSS
jgi:hypothetical protein